MFLLLYLLIYSISNASLKQNLDYLKDKKIINETLYKELKDKESISKEAIIEVLSIMMKKIEEKKDAEDIKVVKDLLSSISPEVIKNSIIISEHIKKLEKIEKEYEQNIKERLVFLENSKRSLNIGFITNLSQNINLISRYEEASNFLPPIFNFDTPNLDFKLLINSKMIKGLNLKTDFFIENNILKFRKFEIEVDRGLIYLSFFKNKEELPSLNDFLRTYNSQEFLLENGLIFNLNVYESDTIKSNLNILGGVNDTPADSKNYLYYAKLINSLKLGTESNKTDPFLNLYYLEKGTNDKDDKKFKGFMTLEAGINIFNNIFKTFDFNLEYSRLVGNDTTENVVESEFMKSIPIFKMENRDALYLYSQLQFHSIKPLKISFGLFENGKIFDTTLGKRYQDPISKLLIQRNRVVFRESDIIEYNNGAGIFGRISLGEGYDHSISLTYSYFEDEMQSLNKLGFESLIKFSNFNLYSDLSLYNIKNPLIKIEEFLIFSSLFDLETKILLTKDMSIEAKKDTLFNVGFTTDLNLPIDIHNLSLAISYFNKGILIDKDIDLNGKNIFSTLIGYENYDISSWLTKGYFKDISLKAAFSYLYTLNKSILGTSNEFQFSLSSYISDFFTEKLSFTPSVAICNKDMKWYPGLNILLSYLINSNCILESSLGNVFEIEKNYFIDRGEKLKNPLPLNRLSYIFNDWAIKIEFNLKI